MRSMLHLERAQSAGTCSRESESISLPMIMRSKTQYRPSLCSLSTLFSLCVVAASSSISVAEVKVSGRVVDEKGVPVVNAFVSPFWLANGRPTKQGGSDNDLLDPAENELFLRKCRKNGAGDDRR